MKKIQIGDNNKIQNNNFGTQINTEKDNKSFINKHPYLVSFFISLFVGLLLLFSFWDKTIKYIEGLF